MSPRNTLRHPGHPADPGRPHRLPHAAGRWSRRTAAPSCGIASLDEVSLSPSGHKRTPSRTVLILEGDDFARLLLGRILEADGYRVAAAANAAAAVARLREKPIPELMLVDLEAPGLCGWRSIRRLKGPANGPEVPLIVVSSLEERLAKGRTGVTAYFEKPVVVEALRQEVRRLLPPR